MSTAADRNDRSQILWAEPSRLRRVEEHRVDNAWVGKLWDADGSRLLTLSAERLLPFDGDRIRCTAPSGSYDPARHFLIGTVDGTPYFVTSGEPDGPVASLRDVSARLSALDRDLATTAVGLINWHRGERFCPRCGSASEVCKAGWMRRCPECSAESFPRTDPAVIVAIIDDHGEQQRLLLGRQSTWGDRVSVFAGFVESGESAEQAVHREMAEEVGVDLREVRYFGSQPWPFPRSLMLGFVAYAARGEFTIDRTEIVYADWFTRDRVRDEVAAGTIALPTTSSIAHRLVSSWLSGQL